MLVAVMNWIAPFILELSWISQMGYADQTWFKVAWKYAAYGNLAFWLIPSIGWISSDYF